MRRSFLMFLLFVGIAPAAGAQRVAMAVSYAQPRDGLARLGRSGVSLLGDLQWQRPQAMLGARVSGLFARLPGSDGAFGSRGPAAEVYGLSVAPRLTIPLHAGIRPYLSVGPGVYGVNSYTQLHLGISGAAGLEIPAGPLMIFGEVAGHRFNSGGVNNSAQQLRTVGAGIRLR